MTTAPETTPATTPDPASAPLEFLQHLYAAAVRRAMPLHSMGAFLPHPPKGRTVMVFSAGPEAGRPAGPHHC
jgi:glycerate 2-kinase